MKIMPDGRVLIEDDGLTPQFCVREGCGQIYPRAKDERFTACTYCDQINDAMDNEWELAKPGASM
jgi:hypothetical protein